MSSATDKTVHIRKRGTDQFHWITPKTWEKMLSNGKGEFYEDVTKAAPSVPKEVAKLATNKKLAGSQTPASDPTHDSTTNTAEHPGEVSGSNT